MKRLTILVDMDDTIENLLGAWVNCLNERHGTSVQYDDITEWDLCNAFPTLTKEQIFSPLGENDFWKSVKPIRGAAQALQWMLDHGHEVYIVTASACETIRPKMENVLFKYFPFLSWNNVIIAHNKQMIRGDIMFDDAPHNLENGHYYKVLVDAPHNRGYDAESNNMYRMKSWDEAAYLIQSISFQDEIAFWRSNPDEFVERYFGVNLLPTQKGLLRLMGGRNNDGYPLNRIHKRRRMLW